MNADFQKRIVTLARDWIGTPYRHQASLKSVGADCLGLIRGVWRDIYDSEPQDIPAYTRGWAEVSDVDILLQAAERHLVATSRTDIQPGDVLMFRYRAGHLCKHAAIAVNTARMIHAYEGAAVCETSIGPWWQRRIAVVFEFPPVSL